MKRGEWKAHSRALASCILLLCGAGEIRAQEETGNLYGIVADTEGGFLPGATIELTGMGAPRVQVADGNGHFRFLGLDPGLYTAMATLDGFSTVEQPNIDIRISQNTRIDL